MRGRRSARWSRRLGALLVLAAVSCAGLLATKIADIKSAPGKYDGEHVTVAGTVVGTTNLLVVKLFTVRDGTGEIGVVTERALPREGDKVTVKGRVNQAFAVAGTSLVVIVEDPETR